MISLRNTPLYILSILGLLLLPTQKVFAQFPNDPQALQWAYATADVYRAWEQTSGAPGVVVAIIDNGFDEEHPDLKDALWLNTDEVPNNGRDDDANGYVDDIHGWSFVKRDTEIDTQSDTDENSEHLVINHATVVAGIIGAAGNNKQYGVGIAYGAKLMNLQVVDENGLGTPEALVEAIYYAANNGADVINISMVGKGSVPEVRSAVNYAYQKGVIVVGAAGNEMENLNESPRFPICNDMFDPYTEVIGVSAIDSTRRLAGFSNIGAGCIDITAPGVDIAGPIRSSSSNNLELYETGWNGTSFAAPFVSAAAALVKSVQPLWHVDQIVRTLQSTVRHTPNPDEAAYAETYGKGLIQIGNAVESAKVGVVLDPKLFVEGEVDTLFTAPRRVLVTSENMGAYADIVQGNKIDMPISVLKDVVAWTTLREKDGTPAYILLKKSGKKSVVMFYTRTWSLAHHWTMDFVPSQILAADIEGDSRKEIITISPREGVLVFSTEGVRLGSITGFENTINTVGVVRNNIQTGKDEVIIASLDDARQVVCMKITSMKTVEKLFDTSMKSVGSIAYLGDGDGAIVIGSDRGTSPQVTVFSVNGEQTVSFRPYDLGFRGGVTVSSVFYGEEGREHIVVTPKYGAQSLRIFDSEGNRVLDKSIDTVVSPNQAVLTAVASF